MSIMTFTREACCKDCIFITEQRLFKKDGTPSKKKRFICGNKFSDRHNNTQYLNDLVCSVWEIKY